MILSNVELHRAIDERRLIISPEPLPRFPTVGEAHCPYDTHSIDLRLADEIVVPVGGTLVYDLTQPGSLAQQIERNSKKFKSTPEQPFTLQPHNFILARTIERVELPIVPNCETCLAARIEGKSSRARIGLLVHFTAPTVHPGFAGTLTLEMINLGPVPIQLVPGMFIAQLIVEEVRGCPRENPSQFQGQGSPSGVVPATH
jgi:dCTP deaminase